VLGATGASAIVPLIAAAANNGARSPIVVFMVVPGSRWVRPRWLPLSLRPANPVSSPLTPIRPPG
jgi:hypothetical protein